MPTDRIRRMAGTYFAAACLAALALGAAGQTPSGLTYPIVDTGQRVIFSDTGQLRTVPKPGEPFYGQEGFYRSNPPRYRDNGDGTVSDLVTGLM